jgi:hypothetical protein
MHIIKEIIDTLVVMVLGLGVLLFATEVLTL